MAPAIVLVHFGKIPGYLKLNIQRMRRLFPTQKIVLVHSQKLHSSFFEENEVELFEYDSNLLDKLGYRIPRLSHDPNFWNGYWQRTFDRLFAIGLYQSQEPETPVLHVESDVTLFPSFPFSSFEALETLAWPKVSGTHDAPAIIYSPSFAAYSTLLKTLIEIGEESPKITDMEALSFFASRETASFSALPTLPPGEVCDMNLQPKDEIRSNFAGVFDGAVLGPYFSGKDSRNSWGFRHRYVRHLGSPLDYSSFGFECDLLGNLKILPDVYVFCLHIHSKRKKYFRPDNIDFLRREVETVNLRRNRVAFEFVGFYKTIKTHGLDYLRAVFVFSKWKNLVQRLVFRKQL